MFLSLECSCKQVVVGEAISSLAGTHEVVGDWGDRDDGGGNNYDRGIKCEAGDAGTDVYENMISFFKVFFCLSLLLDHL